MVVLSPLFAYAADPTYTAVLTKAQTTGINSLTSEDVQLLITIPEVQDMMAAFDEESDGDDDKLRADFQFWKDAGVSHITLNNWYPRPPHTRMTARGPDAHMNALRHYRELVDDLL